MNIPRSPDQLRRDALAIWQAGVDAVRSDRLVRQALRREGRLLVVGDEPLPLDAIGRIAVVGAGKAGAGMAAAVEEVLGPELAREKGLHGWVNVPEDCVRELAFIRLHRARPAGVNEPTPGGAAGTNVILNIVDALSEHDLCLCLISGGGSALLPAPAQGVSLEDKLAVTRFLSAAGANIRELNIVRKQLSRIKGGGLSRACRAGRMVSLIISDVLGDPLDIIASGPTVADTSTRDEALDVLDRFGADEPAVPASVFEYLYRKRSQRAGRGLPSPLAGEGSGVRGLYRKLPSPLAGEGSGVRGRSACRVTNLVIGNLATAVDAAGRHAQRLGYGPALECAQQLEGPAEDVGRNLAEIALAMRSHPGPDCLVSGGEPVVKLIEAARRGDGGRNQQLVLAALERLWEDGARGITLLSGGTDGEDGPTDAAGAFCDAAVIRAARERGLHPDEYLGRNDAYHFFEPLGALLKTGPTHTNVCDVRVVVVGSGEQGVESGELSA